MLMTLMLILAAAGPDSNTYRVAKVGKPDVQLDGRLEEPAWEQAKVENRFTFPWKKSAAPRTEFRAFYDESHLYFAFQVEDADIVVLEQLRDEEDQVFEDRVEMYFAVDEGLKKYFCLEIDFAPGAGRFTLHVGPREDDATGGGHSVLCDRCIVVLPDIDLPDDKVSNGHRDRVRG